MLDAAGVRAGSLAARRRRRAVDAALVAPRRRARSQGEHDHRSPSTRTFSCLSSACVAASGDATPALPRVTATVATRDGTTLRAAAAWPVLHVRGRVSKRRSRPEPPAVPRDTTPPPPSYRIAPVDARVAARRCSPSLLALGGRSARGLRGAAGSRAAAAARQRPDELERALRLAREAETRPPPDRRRALGLLARVLDARDRPLSGTASELAWAKPEPEREALPTLRRRRRAGGAVVSAIPLADAPALRAPARRTFAVRAALAVVCVGAAVAFDLRRATSAHDARSCRCRRTRTRSLVLDLSASISSDTFSRIGGTLAALSRSGSRFGLVVFSDQAYEAFPPGTPAADLAPFVRYFTLPKQRAPGFAPTLPGQPVAVDLHAAARGSPPASTSRTRSRSRAARRATVVLVSDLDDDPGDLPRLASVLLAYRRDHVPVRIVGLNPSPARRRALHAPALAAARRSSAAPTLAEAPPHDTTPFPWTLVALAAVAAAALCAARGVWAPRLDWRRRVSAAARRRSRSLLVGAGGARGACSRPTFAAGASALAGGDAVYVATPARATWTPHDPARRRGRAICSASATTSQLRQALQLYVDAAKLHLRLDNALDVESARAQAQDALEQRVA